MLLVKGLLGTMIQVSFFGLLLIVPAGLVPGGTWLWSRALLFLAVYGVTAILSVTVLAVKAPASLAARLKPPVSARQPVADRVVTTLIILWFLVWFIAMPLDVFYWKPLPPPGFALSVLGALLALGGYLIIFVATYQNSYAVPIVEDQTGSGQTLIDTGLYSVVRHPLYMGILPFVVGVALWLESYVGLIGVTGIVLILIARIMVEEKLLKQTLPGYMEYTERVKYRLVPFFW